MRRRRRREEDGNEDDDNDDDVGLHKEKIEKPMWRLAARNDADFGAKVHFILENPTPCSFHPSGEGLWHRVIARMNWQECFFLVINYINIDIIDTVHILIYSLCLYIVFVCIYTYILFFCCCSQRLRSLKINTRPGKKTLLGGQHCHQCLWNWTSVGVRLGIVLRRICVSKVSGGSFFWSGETVGWVVF